MRLSSRLSVFAALAALIPIAQAKAQDHIYNLNGTYADSKGTGPDLVPEGGAFDVGNTAYVFPMNMGLTLENVFTLDVYTIVFRASLQRVDDYRKMVDFKNKANVDGIDAGYYVRSGHANFYNEPESLDTPYSPNWFAVTTLTRDASGVFTAYVNGVAEITFTDASNHATFSAANNIARFFEDDDFTSGDESSPGTVDYIQIWDHEALSAAQVAALPADPFQVSATPEPGTLALFATGFIGLVGAARRRRASR